MPASLAGIPQWYNARGPIILQAIAASFGESSYVATGGLDQATISSSPWISQPVASHVVTGGPTTTSPVLVQENGVVAAVPFNVSTKFPDWVNQALASASYNVT